jgi:hypothetical protein
MGIREEIGRLAAQSLPPCDGSCDRVNIPVRRDGKSYTAIFRAGWSNGRFRWGLFDVDIPVEPPVPQPKPARMVGRIPRRTGLT